VPCRKANFEAFWSVSRSFGMEKKAEVLNSLSLSPLSETQRERERESARKRSTTSYRRRSSRSREGGAVFCVSLREREREKESELNEERSRESARDGEQQQHAEQHHPRRRRARGERRHLFPRGRFFARRWVESSQHVRTRTGDANRTDPGRAKFAPE
jgi:hypothetical protein